jgi:hypothetical protein
LLISSATGDAGHWAVVADTLADDSPWWSGTTPGSIKVWRSPRETS